MLAIRRDRDTCFKFDIVVQFRSLVGILLWVRSSHSNSWHKHDGASLFAMRYSKPSIAIGLLHSSGAKRQFARASKFEVLISRKNRLARRGGC